MKRKGCAAGGGKVRQFVRFRDEPFSFGLVVKRCFNVSCARRWFRPPGRAPRGGGMRRAAHYRRAGMTAAVDCGRREKRRQCSYEVHQERRKTPWRRVNYRGGNSKAKALGYMVKAAPPGLVRSVLGFVMPAAE